MTTSTMTAAVMAAATAAASATTAATAIAPAWVAAAATAFAGQDGRGAEQKKGSQDGQEGFHRAHSATFAVTLGRADAKDFRLLH